MLEKNSVLLYDQKNFDFIKETLQPESFFNLITREEPSGGTVDPLGYTYYNFLNEDDAAGYRIGEKFNYKLNSDFFRNDHFTTLENGKHNILALGCSHTFGFGLPESFVWPRILESMIKDQGVPVKVFNLGSNGLGIDALVNNAICFIKKYGIPDVIFAIFPGTNRSVAYDTFNKKYSVHIPTLEHLNNRKNIFFNKTKNYVAEDILYVSMKQLAILEMICDALNINLIWFSWEEKEIGIYENLGFKHFINFKNIDNFKINYLKLVPKKFKKYIKEARDSGTHPGIEYQIKMAEIFFNKWRENDYFFKKSLD